jgi:phosphate transport system protein
MTVPLRRAFHEHLEQLDADVAALGRSVEEAVDSAVEALRVGDVESARRINAADCEINARRLEIEQMALSLMATQQPAASDLRRLVAVLHVATDLERIGDYAAGIARICVEMAHRPRVKCVRTISQLAHQAEAMLDGAIEALEHHDADEAQRVALQDDSVDRLYRQVANELLYRMVEDQNMVDEATHLLFVVHNLERVADRAQNVCERIAYASTGRTRLQRRGAA